MIRRDLSEERALEAVSLMRRATIEAVDESLALDAADVALAPGRGIDGGASRRRPERVGR